MRNIDKINQLVDFMDALTNPEAMKKTLMDLKAEKEEHQKYVEEVRKIRNFDHWKLEQEEALKVRSDSLDAKKMELEKMEADVKVKMDSHKQMVEQKSLAMEEKNKELSAREAAVSVLEKERDKLKMDMMRVTEKEKAAEDLKAEYEGKLATLKALT